MRRTVANPLPGFPAWGLKVRRSLRYGLVLEFVWHGGAYIEVRRVPDSPVEVINVWDYATNEPRIPRTKGAMSRRVDDWIAEYPKDALIHDVVENWSY